VVDLNIANFITIGLIALIFAYLAKMLLGMAGLSVPGVT
jgi:hypothetical protein